MKDLIIRTSSGEVTFLGSERKLLQQSCRCSNCGAINKFELTDYAVTDSYVSSLKGENAFWHYPCIKCSEDIIPTVCHKVKESLSQIGKEHSSVYEKLVQLCPDIKL